MRTISFNYLMDVVDPEISNAKMPMHKLYSYSFTTDGIDLITSEARLLRTSMVTFFLYIY